MKTKIISKQILRHFAHNYSQPKLFMRKIYLPILLIGFTLNSFSQQSLRIGGAVGYLDKDVTYGGEFVYTLKIAGNLSLGPGANVLYMKGIGIHVPAFLDIGYHLDPAKKFQLHLDPGFCFTGKEQMISNVRVSTEGSLYLSGGLKYEFYQNGPYVNVQYSRTRFTTLIDKNPSIKTWSDCYLLTVGYSFND